MYKVKCYWTKREGPLRERTITGYLIRQKIFDSSYKAEYYLFSSQQPECNNLIKYAGCYALNGVPQYSCCSPNSHCDCIGLLRRYLKLNKLIRVGPQSYKTGVLIYKKRKRPGNTQKDISSCTERGACEDTIRRCPATSQKEREVSLFSIFFCCCC